MKQLVLSTELKWLSKYLKSKSQEFLMSQIFLNISKKTVLSESEYKITCECVILNAFKNLDINLPTLVKLDLTAEEQENTLFSLLKFYIHPVFEQYSEEELKEKNITIPILSNKQKEEFLFEKAKMYKNIIKNQSK